MNCYPLPIPGKQSAVHPRLPILPAADHWYGEKHALSYLTGTSYWEQHTRFSLVSFYLHSESFSCNVKAH